MSLYTTKPPVQAPPAVAPPSAPPSVPPHLAPRPAARTRWPWIVAIAAALVAGAIAGGVAGVITGAHRARPVTTTSPAAPMPPTVEQVHAQTVQLCTAWAVGTRAMPIPQTRAIDVLPSINYIAAALAANPVADPGIRAAMTTDLALSRQQADALTNEPAAGAIQPATGWSADASNDSEENVFKLCRAYTG